MRQHVLLAFAATGPRADDITKILPAMGTVMDVLNPIRNNPSIAHPNKDLLDTRRQCTPSLQSICSLTALFATCLPCH